MPESSRYAVQMFRKDAKGKFQSDKVQPCKSADEARQRAERASNSGAHVGAAAFLLRGDELIGMTEEPIAIAVFGSVPPEIADNIPF